MRYDSKLLFRNLFLTVLAYSIVYSLIYFYLDAIFPALVLGIGLFTAIPLIYTFDQKGYGRLARFSLITLCTIYVSAAALGVPFRTDIEFYFLPSAMLSLLLFEPTEKLETRIGFSIPTLGWISTKIGLERLLPESWLPELFPFQFFSYFDFLGAFLVTVIFLAHYNKHLDHLKQKAARELEKNIETKQRLEEAQRVAKIGSWSFDIFSKTIHWSKQMFELFNRSHELDEPRYSTHLESIFSEDRENWEKTVEACIKDGLPYQIRFRVHAGDRLRWIQSIGQGNRDKSGSIVSLTGTCQDISELVAQEERLASMSLWNQLILKSSGLLIISTEPDGTISTMNFTAEKALGYASNELVGKATPEIFHESTEIIERIKTLHKEFGVSLNPGAEVFFYKALRVGQDTHEWTMIRKDGTRFPIRLMITAIRDEQSNLRGFLGVAEDITEQKKLEQSIEQQKIMLHESARLASLGEMAGGVAHEINNPLAIIHGKALQIRKALEAPEVDRTRALNDLQRIEVTTDRIAKIVRGLHAFSRNSEGDSMQVYPLQAIIDEVLDLCRERFKHHSVELRLQELTPDKIKCRPAQMGQILINLISNAFDAVQSLSEKWVEISVKRLGNRVQIFVTDSGRGIPPEIAKKILQPFFTTKEVGKGTGLGLSISVGIAHDHGGELKYDSSAPNTRFIVDLPLAEAQEPLSAA